MRERWTGSLEHMAGMGWLIPDYAFLYAAATVLGIYLAVREAERGGLDAFAVFKACLVIVVAALAGSRLFVVAQYWEYFRLHMADIVKIWDGGTASTGAYIGGIFAAVVSAGRLGLPTARFLNCCAPSAALAIGLGRIGCFLNGCCYGRPSDLPWAVVYPAGSGPYHDHLAAGLITSGSTSLPVHPTQLYEALFAFALFVLLLFLRSRWRREGSLTAVFFISYPAFRFFNEFFRADDRGAVGMLSVPQILALMMITAVCVFLVRKRMKPTPYSSVKDLASEEQHSSV